MTREQLVRLSDLRLNEVESRMTRNPEAFPAFTAAREEEAKLMGKPLHNHGVDSLILDRLVSSLTAQGAEVAIEMYIAGFLDGGHGFHLIQ